MGVTIPNGYGMVIHQITDNVNGEVSSITLGINPDEQNLVAAVTAADESFRVGFPAASFDSQATLQPAIMYHRSGSNLGLYQSTLATLPGTTSQSSPPPQVSVVIRKRTEFVGKSRRGRVYLPHWYVQEGLVSEQGIINTTPLATLQGRADDWLESLQTQSELGDGMWLFHSDPLQSPDKVTQLLVQPIVRTQRRRLPSG